MEFKLARTWENNKEKKRNFLGGYVPPSLIKDIDLVSLSRGISRTEYMVQILSKSLEQETISSSLELIYSKVIMARQLNLMETSSWSTVEFLLKVKTELNRHKLKETHIIFILEKLQKWEEQRG